MPTTETTKPNNEHKTELTRAEQEQGAQVIRTWGRDEILFVVRLGVVERDVIVLAAALLNIRPEGDTMPVRDLDRWEETDEPGVYRRRVVSEATPAPTSRVAPAAATESDATEPDVEATAGALDLAAEHDLDLATVSGTGKDGRITKTDVEAAL